jgi:hypothetical protein
VALLIRSIAGGAEKQCGVARGRTAPPSAEQWHGRERESGPPVHALTPEAAGHAAPCGRRMPTPCGRRQGTRPPDHEPKQGHRPLLRTNEFLQRNGCGVSLAGERSPCPVSGDAVHDRLHLPHLRQVPIRAPEAWGKDCDVHAVQHPHGHPARRRPSGRIAPYATGRQGKARANAMVRVAITANERRHLHLLRRHGIDAVRRRQLSADALVATSPARGAGGPD